MKNILLLGSLLLCFSICDAQFEKGQKLIGGQLGFSMANDAFGIINSSTHYTSLYLNSSLSKFKSPVVLNGFGISYHYNYEHSNIGNAPTEQTSYQHSFGLFYERTRLVPLVQKLNLSFTGTGGLNYSFGKVNNPDGSIGINMQNISPYVSGSLGLWYQLGKRLLLTCELANLVAINYAYVTSTSYSTTKDYKSSSTRFNFRTGLTGGQLGGLMFGLRYVLK